MQRTPITFFFLTDDWLMGWLTQYVCRFVWINIFQYIPLYQNPRIKITTKPIYRWLHLGLITFDNTEIVHAYLGVLRDYNNTIILYQNLIEQNLSFLTAITARVSIHGGSTGSHRVWLLRHVDGYKGNNTREFSYIFIQHNVFLAFILPKLLYSTAISYICIYMTW